MSLAVSTSVRPSNPLGALDEAIHAFVGVLSQDERGRLRQLRTVPCADAALVFTAELYAQNQSMRGSSTVRRLDPILQAVRDFSSVVDTFVSSHPSVAALVWGSVKFAVLFISNFASYFEEFSKLFTRFRDYGPRFEEYRVLFPESYELKVAICKFHASIIYCCKHVVEVTRRSALSHVLSSYAQSFAKEFEPDLTKIRSCSEEVKECILLAKTRADADFQELQRREGRMTRQGLVALFSVGQKTSNELKGLHLRQYERLSRNEKQQLLEKLSSYDFQRSFQEACQKRHNGTALWISSTAEWDRWMNQKANLLWCTGKIGSGKTMIAANAINQAAVMKSEDDHIVYFFIRYDDAQSLKADVVLRSIVRQSLSFSEMSDQTENELRDILSNPFFNIQHLMELFKKTASISRSLLIFIDGADECDSAERRILLKSLSALIFTGSPVKIFLASRESISKELKASFPCIERISTTHAEAAADIATYVEEEVELRLAEGRLEISDPALLDSVKEELKARADGMFLWISYLLDDLGHQHTDDDVRERLENLPKNLEQTFIQILNRIASQGNSSFVQKVFPWVAVAKRNLTLDELSETATIKVGQPSLNPGARLNTSRVASLSENLLLVDEEYQTVQFAHRSIFDFITGGSSAPAVADMHVRLQEANHRAGELCLTYLYSTNFQTTLARVNQDQIRIVPADIAKKTFGEGTWKSKMAQKLINRRSNPELQKGEFIINASYGRANDSTSSDALRKSNPFLKYAEKHWIAHTSDFDPDATATWTLWERILRQTHELAKYPWNTQDSKLSRTEMLEYAAEEGHAALLTQLDKGQWFSESEKQHLLYRSAKRGHVHLVPLILNLGIPQSIERALVIAAFAGSLEIVELLLGAAVDTNELDHGLAALHTSNEGNHLDVVDRLLSTRAAVSQDSVSNTTLQDAYAGNHFDVIDRLMSGHADANAMAMSERSFTALQAACAGGHIEIVDRLLSIGVDVNAGPHHIGGRTALQAAAEFGYDELVDKLLSAGADVNANPSPHRGLTALQAACAGGHLVIVYQLLTSGAHVNAPACSHRGFTALQAAAGGGHSDVVSQLLFSGADVNGERSAHRGITALQAACGGGHIEIVQGLLLAGADVNASPEETGYTALQAACRGGHFITVDELLDNGADVNAGASPVLGFTALQGASASGSLVIVDELLGRGADVNAACSSGGRTALQAACLGGHLAVVNRLLAYGAQVNAPASQIFGRTALQAASGNGHLSIVNRLLEAGADVNAAASPNSGFTALQAACRGGRVEIVNRLLSAGANVYAPAAQFGGGCTAHEAASKSGHQGIYALLGPYKPPSKVPYL